MTVLTTEKNLEDPFKEVPQKSSQRLTHKTKNLWRVIAKNEIKLRTSRFRNYRKLFFISLYVLLSIWAFLLAPFLFDLFIPTLAVQFSSIFKPVVAILIESSMMILFLVLMMYPLNNVYRETEIGFKETLISTPAKANDIFLGEFLGKSPIYTIAVLVFAPIIVGLINPIINLTIVQYIVIYSSIFGLVYFANLIGTIIASWIEHKITQSEKARDLGKALIWIFTILLVVIMYAVMFFLNFLLAHPELKNWLSFYPSFWFSNLILYSIDPILLNTSVLNVWLSLLLVIGVPILILYISYKKSELFYTLETGIEKSSVTIIEHESLFYRIVRKGAGRKWGGLILIQLKRFLRKKANFARIAYVVGLVGFISWFISRMGGDAFGLTLATTMIIALGGGVTSVMIGHLAFLDSKDIIWVYKRSPRGIKGLVYSYLLAMLVLNIFITIIITILFSVFANLDFIGSVIFFFEYLLFGQISMSQAMGIQCISPAYGEKDSNMRGNAMISMLLLQPIMFIPIMLIIFLDMGSIELMISMMHGIIFLYNVGIGLPLLYFGLKKLNKIE